MNWKILDLHCDTALELLGTDLQPRRTLRSNPGHIDLERAKGLDGYAQCFAMFTYPGFTEEFGRPVPEVFDAAVSNLLRELESNGDLIRQARSADEIRANDAAGKMSAILTIEGPAGFDFDPGRLEQLYALGFRISTLGWNEKNVLSGSNQTGGGLTELGRTYVRECQRLGILVDVSHLSDEGFWDIMDITEKPVIASHSNSRAVCGHPRNLTDEMFSAICRTGGTAGINLYTAFLGDGKVTFDTVCDHIFHFLELDPDGTHISLGGDLDGCESVPEGFAGVESYQLLAEHMMRRGLSEQTVRNICWNNAMGVMERAVCNHQK